jgi:hypothetical protein
MSETESKSRPIIAVDVDGVLRFDTDFVPPGCPRPANFRPHRVEYGGETFLIDLDLALGPMLLELARETGAELMWGSRWNEGANDLLVPLLGLPALPVLPAIGEIKAYLVVAGSAGRPLVWLDDQAHELDAARQITGRSGQRFLGVHVDARRCLRPEHLATARAWLDGLEGNPEVLPILFGSW